MTKILVTGAAGQIAYALIFRLAAGELFGKSHPITLYLLDIEEKRSVLEGVKMELFDGAYDLLKEVVVGSDPEALSEGVDFAFLIGAFPRSKGMERKDLLSCNAPIFEAQGKALRRASKKLQALVVGNPCNTNALILSRHLGRKEGIYAMTELDSHRARALLALKLKCLPSEIKNLHIWGNHSTTQVPDALLATFGGEKIGNLLPTDYLCGDFIKEVANRGAAVINQRGASSAASAAEAALDFMRHLIDPKTTHFCGSVYSEGNPYGIDQDLFFSFPLVKRGEFEVKIDASCHFDPRLEAHVRASERELCEEREAIAHLLRS